MRCILNFGEVLNTKVQLVIKDISIQFNLKILIFISGRVCFGDKFKIMFCFVNEKLTSS